MPRVLLIEDMPSVRKALASALRKAGHDVVEAVDGNDGIGMTKRDRFDVVITDIMMPHSDGTDVISALKNEAESPPVIAMSGGGAGIPAEVAMLVAKQTADVALIKPFENDALFAAIDGLT